MIFLKWHSRIALALGLSATIARIVFGYRSSITSFSAMSMTFEGVASFFTLIISGCLLVQALIVTLKFSARVRASCAPLSNLRREMRWHLAALALIAVGFVTPMTFSSIAAATSHADVPTELVGYNHTDDEVEFAVDGLSGGILQPGTGGGSFICCVVLPVPWHAGLNVKVEWRNSDRSFTRLVAVPPYDTKTVSDFNIHFLRSGEVKVFPLHYGLYHAGYPLRGKEAELVPGKPILPLYK